MQPDLSPSESVLSPQIFSSKGSICVISRFFFCCAITYGTMHAAINASPFDAGSLALMPGTPTASCDNVIAPLHNATDGHGAANQRRKGRCKTPRQSPSRDGPV